MTEKTKWYKENHISHDGGRWLPISRVEEWAEEKGLLGNTANPDRQMLKLMEEVGETARALAYNDVDEIRDGIGDCVVVLIILAAQCGMTLEECMDEAWNEIKDRTGKLEDGLFKKDSDL